MQVRRRNPVEQAQGAADLKNSVRSAERVALDEAQASAEPLAVSIKEVCRLTSLGRTHAFALIRDQKIEARRIGRRTLILTRSIKALLRCADDQA